MLHPRIMRRIFSIGLPFGIPDGLKLGRIFSRNYGFSRKNTEIIPISSPSSFFTAFLTNPSMAVIPVKNRGETLREYDEMAQNLLKKRKIYQIDVLTANRTLEYIVLLNNRKS